MRSSREGRIELGAIVEESLVDIAVGLLIGEGDLRHAAGDPTDVVRLPSAP